MIKIGTAVRWEQGAAAGIVRETHADIVGRVIDGDLVTRRGKDGDRALVIRKDDGQEIVKLESEVEPLKTKQDILT